MSLNTLYFNELSLAAKACFEDVQLVETLARVADATAERLSAGGTLYLCGNGGSAALCGHIHAELRWRVRMAGGSIDCVDLTSNPATLTAIANDDDYAHVFSRQLLLNGASRDNCLWCFTTSGHSSNILEAMRTAHLDCYHVTVFTNASTTSSAYLTANKDEIVSIPSTNAQIVQDLHEAVAHVLCLHLEQVLR